MSKFLSIIFFFSINVSFAQNVTNDSKVVVAEVNGVKIYKKELDEAYAQSLLIASNKKITKQNTLDFLINRRVGIDQAKKEKIDKDPFVQSKMEDILNQALLSKNVEDKIANIVIKDDEIKSYYNNNKEYRSSHILYRLRAVPSKDEVKKGFEIMTEIHNEIKKNPKDFDLLAKKHTQAAAGPDIGFQPTTSLSPEYFEAIKDKEIGFITAPIRTQFGFHIIKITGVKSFEQIDKELYKKIIFDIKRDEIIKSYYDDLKKNFKVKVFSNNLE